MSIRYVAVWMPVWLEVCVSIVSRWIGKASVESVRVWMREKNTDPLPSLPLDLSYSFPPLPLPSPPVPSLTPPFLPLGAPVVAEEAQEGARANVLAAAWAAAEVSKRHRIVEMM
jgi:hypothetical protein